MDYSYIRDEYIEKKLGISVVKVDHLETKDKRLLNKLVENKVILGGDEKVNRAAVESKAGLILLHPERHSGSDSFNQRQSGLNSALCRLARKNNVVVGFSFSYVLNSTGKERAKIIGRMMQNVRLCRKYKVDMVLGNFATSAWQLRSYDCLKSFGYVIGMNGLEVKNALNYPGFIKRFK